MVHLNDHNGASKYTLDKAKTLLREFPGTHLYGVEMGIAYGGGVEAIGKLWGDRGTIYGFDTFEGHPTHLAVDKSNREATCMEHWYQDKIYGTATLSLEYQQAQLDASGLDNVKLVKGEVTKDSCKDIPHLHYAFLDMDILVSMEAGYEAVKDKIVKGGYLLMHDVVTDNNLPLLHKWFWEDVVYKNWDKWAVEAVLPAEHLAILKRK